jgi:hypothetical protein
MAKKHKILRTEEDITPLNRKIINAVCHKCNFYAEEQEYWEKEYECGAYKLVRQMIKEDLITFEQIKDLFNKIDLNPLRELK